MYLFDINWIYSLYASAMIMTGIDLEVNVTTDGQRLFIIIYAFVVIFLLLSMVNLGIQYFFNSFY